jgi:release factor glutamine methyltransferase
VKATAPATTVETARRRLAQELRAAGLDSPELDARLLVAHAVGLDHAGLAARARCPLGGEEARAIAALAARRLAREPVARILGRKEFWGLPLAVNADTLVPRPETETVVEAVLEALGPSRSRVHRIADLGTGTGALLLALLTELPAAFGVGTDISMQALDCARGNAASLGLSTRSAFAVCDYAAALAGPFELIVANPPYVARADIAGLAPEVRDHDPRRALDGGPDGLDGYRAIAADAARLLAPDGMLAVELGLGQAAAVGAIFVGASLAPAALKHDLSGVARALVFNRVP